MTHNTNPVFKFKSEKQPSDQLMKTAKIDSPHRVINFTSNYLHDAKNFKLIDEHCSEEIELPEDNKEYELAKERMKENEIKYRTEFLKPDSSEESSVPSSNLD